jgi:hypothetical protein
MHDVEALKAMLPGKDDDVRTFGVADCLVAGHAPNDDNTELHVAEVALRARPDGTL